MERSKLPLTNQCTLKRTFNNVEENSEDKYISIELLSLPTASVNSRLFGLPDLSDRLHSPASFRLSRWQSKKFGKK